MTRDVTLSEATADAQIIRRAAGECLKRVPLERRLRLLGVRAGSLVTPGEARRASPRLAEPPAGPTTAGLFDD